MIAFCMMSAIVLVIYFMSLPAIADTTTNGNANDDSTFKTIMNTLESITCEHQGGSNLLRAEFTHTCVPDPFSTFVVANIVSPGLYPSVLLRLAINDPTLFPNSCKSNNRIDFYDQKISFGICNNVKLYVARGIAAAKSVPIIARALITGNDPWETIRDSWNRSKEEYYIKYEDQREGYTSVTADIGMFPIMPLKIIKKQDKLCVATLNIIGSIAGLGSAITGKESTASWIPVGCKYIKEPFPVSLYADFMDVTSAADFYSSKNSINHTSSEAKNSEKIGSLTSCSGADDCYKRAKANSKAAIVITGPIIECVKQMIAKLLVSSAVCSFDDAQDVLGSPTRTSSSLYKFQRNMHAIVSSLLTIYIILFGFKILLSGNVPPKSEMINFIVKFLFVVYFSVGINVHPGSDNDLYRLDGMIQWAFPFLLDGMTELAGWIANADPSELCKFSDLTYPTSLSHLRLWDSIDCKLSHYLGLDAIQTMVVEEHVRNHDFSGPDTLESSVPPYIILLLPAIISGNTQLIALLLLYPVLVISMIASVVGTTVLCMISIVILGILAPLFVPLCLFNYTKRYFDAWVKLLLSFMLQPMVSVVFLTMMLSLYDFGFYGTCKYVYRDFSYAQIADNSVNRFATTNSPESAHRVIRYFYLDKDWHKNYKDQEEVDNCRKSLGFILNNLFESAAKVTTSEDKTNPAFAGSVEEESGGFFTWVSIIFERVRAIVSAMVFSCFILYLMRHLSDNLTEFAADMTEGISTGKILPKPSAIGKAITNAGSSVAKMMPKGKSASATRKVGGTESGSASDKQASDSIRQSDNAPKEVAKEQDNKKQNENNKDQDSAGDSIS